MSHVSTLRDLLARSFSRYLKVTPNGFQPSHADRTLPAISATILTFRPARTLYQNRKPVCRSLDGVQALIESRTCGTCLLRKTCIPQICLEILYQGMPLRLMLAYTSAKNFMLFVSRQQQAGTPLEGSPVKLNVLDRGRWGEICFAPDKPAMP
ncbi:MAG: hypothetical protein AAB403_09235 [Planctomycetota bacterium]